MRNFKNIQQTYFTSNSFNRRQINELFFSTEIERGNAQRSESPKRIVCVTHIWAELKFFAFGNIRSIQAFCHFYGVIKFCSLNISSCWRGVFFKDFYPLQN